MLALLRKTIIFLFISSFTFSFSMNTHNNDFEEHLDPQYPNHTTAKRNHDLDLRKLAQDKANNSNYTKNTQSNFQSADSQNQLPPNAFDQQDCIEESLSNLFEEISPTMDPAEVSLLINNAPREIQETLSTINLIKQGVIKRATIYFFIGKPGVGKTALAQAIASYCGLNAWLINCPGLRTEYANHATRRIKDIFALFKNLNRPHILIFDEINQIMNITNNFFDESQRAGLRSCFWECLDNNLNNPNLILIATANDIDQLPPQLKNRIQSDIYEILPNYDISVIKSLMKLHLNHYNDLTEQELSYWATQLSKKHISAREITRMIHQAIQIVQCKSYNCHKMIKVTYNDIEIQFKRLLTNRYKTKVDRKWYQVIWDNLAHITQASQYTGLILPLSQIIIQTAIHITLHYHLPSYPPNNIAII